jgi:hypothetical protein
MNAHPDPAPPQSGDKVSLKAWKPYGGMKVIH